MLLDLVHQAPGGPINAGSIAAPGHDQVDAQSVGIVHGLQNIPTRAGLCAIHNQIPTVVKVLDSRIVAILPQEDQIAVSSQVRKHHAVRDHGQADACHFADTLSQDLCQG